MQAFTGSLTRLFSRLASSKVKDETVPFAQSNHEEFCNETADFDQTKSSEKTPTSLQVCEGRELRRRDTVSGIEKPTISTWDAGWNVSNAIQVPKGHGDLIFHKLNPSDNRYFSQYVCRVKRIHQAEIITVKHLIQGCNNIAWERVESRFYRIGSTQIGEHYTKGMFVLGLPVGIRFGGYVGLLMIAVAAVLCYYTGKILINCLYEVKDNRKIRVRGSYFDVAVDCWGAIGGHVVNLAQLIELLMTCVLYIVVSGNLMKSSFPNVAVTEAEWSVISSLALFFCILLRDLKAVSCLSFGCSIAQFVVMGITMFYCLLDIGQWKWSKLTFNVNGKKFPVSIGVIVFSYTSQIFLPSLENSMERRKEFRRMLCWSYIVSCAMKELFALFCFLTWADETQDVVTDNLPPGLRAAINIMLVVKALLSYPLPYYQSLEIIEQSIFTNVTGGWGTLLRTKKHTYSGLLEEKEPTIQSTSFVENNPPTSSENKSSASPVNISPPTSPEEEKPQRSAPTEKTVLVNLDEYPARTSCGFPSCYNAEGSIQLWAMVLRALLVLGTLILAIYIPHFALLMGFTGSLTGTLLAFLLPCAFHLQLKRKEISWIDILLDVAIFIFGFLCAFIGLYYSVIGLYEAFHPSQWPSNFTLPLVGNVSSKEAAAENWFPDFPEKSQDFA